MLTNTQHLVFWGGSKLTKDTQAPTTRRKPAVRSYVLQKVQVAEHWSHYLCCEFDVQCRQCVVCFHIIATGTTQLSVARGLLLGSRFCFIGMLNQPTRIRIFLLEKDENRDAAYLPKGFLICYNETKRSHPVIRAPGLFLTDSWVGHLFSIVSFVSD